MKIKLTNGESLSVNSNDIFLYNGVTVSIISRMLYDYNNLCEFVPGITKEQFQRMKNIGLLKLHDKKQGNLEYYRFKGVIQ